MTNPILNLTSKAHKTTLWFLGFSTLVIFIALNFIDSPLKTSAAPNGIVSFELAGNFAKSQSMLDSWNEQAKLTAALRLGVDYLFLVFYSLFFALVIFQISKIIFDQKKWLIIVGIALGWLQLLAGIFDALENYFLLRLLFGSQNEMFSSLAFYFASAKFLLIALGLVYIFFVIVSKLFLKLR